jgi:hypothetical protein
MFTEINLLVEGNLPAAVIEQLLNELTTNLHRDTHQAWSWQEQDPTETD